MSPDLTNLLDHVKSFESSAHQILGMHESTKLSRVTILEKTYEKLDDLDIRQDDMMRQALRCAETGLFRAAHVMAWAALMDCAERALEENIIALHVERPKWGGKDIREIAETVPERQLIEVLKPLNLATKNETSALLGLLQRRNECAHPSEYLPGLNETLGYLAEILQRMKIMLKKWTVTTKTAN